MIFGGSSGLLVKRSDIFEKSSKTTLLVCVYIINNIVSSRVHRQVQHYKRNFISVRAHESLSIFLFTEENRSTRREPSESSAKARFTLGTQCRRETQHCLVPDCPGASSLTSSVKTV